MNPRILLSAAFGYFQIRDLRSPGLAQNLVSSVPSSLNDLVICLKPFAVEPFHLVIALVPLLPQALVGRLPSRAQWIAHARNLASVRASGPAGTASIQASTDHEEWSPAKGAPTAVRDGLLDAGVAAAKAAGPSTHEKPLVVPQPVSLLVVRASPEAAQECCISKGLFKTWTTPGRLLIASAKALVDITTTENRAKFPLLKSLSDEVPADWRRYGPGGALSGPSAMPAG
jgi:hypothetical protein